MKIKPAIGRESQMACEIRKYSSLKTCRIERTKIGEKKQGKKLVLHTSFVAVITERSLKLDLPQHVCEEYIVERINHVFPRSE